MKFDDLDKKMREFETAHDRCIPTESYIIARIDGRSFTQLTKEKCDFERPFDVRFRDMMIETTKHLMNSGFKVIYGYTESDEISLLFDPGICAFGRKTRKYVSILAGEASAKFSLLLGALAAFDCRIIEIPDKRVVVDYFRWRNEDAHRNAMNAHCYWMLRKENLPKNEAILFIEKKTLVEKKELLLSRGINFDEIADWQKYGIGLYWGVEEKKGFNPKDQIEVVTKRNVIKVDLDLPKSDKYGDLVMRLLSPGT